MTVGSKEDHSRYFVTRITFIGLLVAAPLGLLVAPAGSRPVNEVTPVTREPVDGVVQEGKTDRIVFSGRYCDAGPSGGGSSGCNFDIYAVTLDGSEPERVLLNYGTDEIFPTFSPDGTEIAYNSWDKEWHCDSHVWLVEADGSLPRMISSPVNAWDESLGWSPHGEIAFLRWPQGPTCEWGDAHGDVYLLSRMAEAWSEDPLLTRAGSEYTPEFSPDGRRIAYAYDRDEDATYSPGESRQLDIWVSSSDGGRHKRLTRTPRQVEAGPTWSPDGRTIAFSRGSPSADSWWIPRGRATIWLMRADGSDKRKLTPRGYLDLNPAWSPDGTRIAFTRCYTQNEPPDCAIALITVSDPERVEIVAYEKGYTSHQPSWDPAP
jgi:Tol biopolymer transport system component